MALDLELRTVSTEQDWQIASNVYKPAAVAPRKRPPARGCKGTRVQLAQRIERRRRGREHAHGRAHDHTAEDTRTGRHVEMGEILRHAAAE
jgi:hypothetical protein